MALSDDVCEDGVGHGEDHRGRGLVGERGAHRRGVEEAVNRDGRTADVSVRGTPDVPPADGDPQPEHRVRVEVGVHLVQLHPQCPDQVGDDLVLRDARRGHDHELPVALLLQVDTGLVDARPPARGLQYGDQPFLPAMLRGR